MICVSIAEPKLEIIHTILESLREGEIAEIRLDQMELSLDEIQGIFSQPYHELIATCRPGKYDDYIRMSQLKTAISAGAEYIDVELESKLDYMKELISFCRKYDCRIIVSHHDYQKTPSLNRLREIIDECFACGCDIAKVACMAASNVDSSRLLALYEDQRKLVAIGMGPYGTITRVAAPLLGAPFTFASLGSGYETAPGQLDRTAMARILKELRYGI